MTEHGSSQRPPEAHLPEEQPSVVEYVRSAAMVGVEVALGFTIEAVQAVRRWVGR